jgi:dienelactone hydrolase
VADVVAFYDAARRTYGSDAPICASGASAGGHLALLLATRRSLYCVISRAGIADPGSLPRQTTVDAATGARTSEGPRVLFNWLVSAFGQENVAAVSPQRLGVRTRVLFGVGATDTYVPAAQPRGLRAAMRAADPDAYVDVDVMPFGSQPFVHTTVTDAALADFHRREQALVAPLGRKCRGGRRSKCRQRARARQSRSRRR